MLRFTPVALVVGLLLTACGALPRDDLNDAAKSVSRPDPVSLGAGALPRLFETREAEGLAVSYNFIQKGRAGSVLRLTVRNTSTAAKHFSPTVRVTDDAGYDLVPYTFMALVRLAAAVTEGPVPDAFFAQAADCYNAGPTGRDVVQNLADLKVFPALGLLPSGVNDGTGSGEAIAPDQRRRDAAAYLDWLSKFWLRKSYTLAPGQTVSAMLIFPDRAAPLPLRVDVEFGEAHFRFTTASQAR